MARWVLWVRDSDRRLVAQIEDFTSASFALRFNDVGGWYIKGIPMTSEAAQYLVPGAGIVAVRDGVVEMAGPLLFPTVNWSTGGWVMDASGASDDFALWARLCYPAAPSLVLTAAYSDDRAGVASTIMRQYVNVNAAAGADVTRRWAGLVLDADPLVGGAVTYSARLDVLGDVLAQLGIVSDLGFRVLQDVDGTDLAFQVYEPEDRSGTARFSSQIGNLAAYTYSRQAPQVTRTIVGGGGEGVLRTFVERSDATAEALWGMRLESFRDQRQTTDLTDLQQAGDEELADKGAQTSLALTPVETLAVPYREGYALGDLVTVVVDSVPIVDRVRSVELVLAADGEQVLPTVGTTGVVEAGTDEERAMDVLLGRMLDLSRRLSRLATAT